MFDLTTIQWLWVILAALLLGITKAGVAGLGTISILIMADVFAAKMSSGVILPMLIVGDIMAVIYYRRHANWPLLIKLIPPAIVGIVIGWFLMGRLEDAGLRVIIGLVVLFFLLFNVLRDRGVIKEERIPEGWAFAVPICVVAGIITMMMNAAGPLMLVYFLSLRLEKNRFIGTMAWYFLVLNVLKVPLSVNLGYITPESFLFNMKLAPAILVGGLIGVNVVKHLSNKKYQVWVQIIAAIGACRMLHKGLVALGVLAGS
jgi:uncharacterized membrane protein YfcA